MYIDTHSRESMEKSICALFCMNPLELYEQLTILARSVDDDDDYIQKLDAFVAKRVTAYPDEILLFHLSRRLHGTEDATEGRNLADLLLSVNPFSSFLKENYIEFAKGKQHIDVIYRGEIVDWEKCWNGNPSYMKVRLGYIKGREDFCFNGFALKDLLHRNSYLRDLSGGPEFLGQLIGCLQCEDVGKKYMEKSTYYCYEYKLPLSIVVFDDYDQNSEILKQRYLLCCILQRLYRYHTSNQKFMYDRDNLILRLADDYTVPSEYYVGRELIKLGMLN